MNRNFVSNFLARQMGGMSIRNPGTLSSNPAYLPESSFESLEVCKYHRFEDTFNTYESPPLTLTISGDRIASANDTGDVMILNKHDFSPITKFTAHTCAIFDLKWREECGAQSDSGSGTGPRQFLTCSGDRSIVLWDIERPNCAVQNFFSAHHGSVKTLSFYDTNLFASGGRDGTIKFWDLRASSTALKCGPEFCIDDPHINRLPSVKSPRSFRATRSSLSRATNRHSPIATSQMQKTKSILPSNVVTCLSFCPTYNHHLYSSGISDSTIKVWDIRKCRRQYQCSYTPSAIKTHSIKNCAATTTRGTLSSSSGHGFSSFIFSHDPKYGNVLMASSTDSKVYAFANETTHPLMIFSGRISNHFSRLSSFGGRYLLSGSSNGRGYIWNSTLTMPQMESTSSDQIQIENRFPLYELQFQDTEDISLVIGDSSTMSIYNSSDTQILYKWAFAPCLGNKEQFERMDMRGLIPKCHAYVPDLSDAARSNLTERTVTLKRPASSFLSTVSYQSSRFNKSENCNTPDTTKPALSLITNWIHNTPDNNDPKDGFNVKRLKTQTTKQQSLSTSSKTTNKSGKPVKRSNSRRSLFCNSRKISEYFLTP